MGGSKLWFYFSPFVDQSSPDYVSRRGRDHSLQRRFPIVDTLLRSGDIRDRRAKSFEIAPKKHVYQPANFFAMEDPQILDLVFKIAPISDHVAKFRGDRPRDGVTAEISRWIKKRKKETAAKHKARLCVITQRAALIGNNQFKYLSSSSSHSSTS